MKQCGANRRCWKRTTTSADQIPGADRCGGNELDQLLQQPTITNTASIPVEQPQIGQQWSPKQLPFGDGPEVPALAVGVGRGDRLFAADVRPMEFS